MVKVVGYDRAVEMLEQGLWFYENFGGVFTYMDGIKYVIRESAWNKIYRMFSGKLIKQKWIERGYVTRVNMMYRLKGAQI